MRAKDDALMVLVNECPNALLMKDSNGKTPKQIARQSRVQRLLRREERRFNFSPANEENCSSRKSAPVSDNEDEQVPLSSENDAASPPAVVSMEIMAKNADNYGNQDKGPNTSEKQSSSLVNQSQEICTSPSTREQRVPGEDCTFGSTAPAAVTPQQQYKTSSHLQQSSKRPKESNEITPFQAKKACTSNAAGLLSPSDNLTCAIAERESMFGIIPTTNQKYCERVGAIEEVVFGERRQGSLMSRINALLYCDQDGNLTWNYVIKELEDTLGNDNLSNENVVVRVEGLERTIWGDECVEVNRGTNLRLRVKALVGTM